MGDFHEVRAECLGQAASPLYASVSPSVKWNFKNDLPESLLGPHEIMHAKHTGHSVRGRAGAAKEDLRARLPGAPSAQHGHFLAV